MKCYTLSPSTDFLLNSADTHNTFRTLPHHHHRHSHRSRNNINQGLNTSLCSCGLSFPAPAPPPSAENGDNILMDGEIKARVIFDVSRSSSLLGQRTNKRTTIAGTSNGRAKSLKFHEITQFRCFPTTTPTSLLSKWNANKSHAGFPVLFELCALKYKTYIYGLQHNIATAKCHLAALFVRCSNITTQRAPLVGVGGRLVALGCVKKISANQAPYLTNIDFQ